MQQTRQKLTLASVDNFEAIPGFGVSATVDGRSVSVGADRFMKQLWVRCQSVRFIRSKIR